MQREDDSSMMRLQSALPARVAPRPRNAANMALACSVLLRFCGCFFAIFLLAASARAGVSKEYQIKAAFLYNFAKFVEWPPQRFSSPDAPLVIGVFGENPFGDELENLVKGRKINHHEVVVKHLKTVDEARKAHLVFLSSAEDGHIGETLDALRGAGVLTVGETHAFSDHSGMIEFLLEGDKLRFEINVGAAEGDGLKISAQLLKLATNVRRKDTRAP